MHAQWFRVENFADEADCVFAEAIVEGQAFLGQIMVSRPQFLDS
jgi:hypothetical protein